MMRKSLYAPTGAGSGDADACAGSLLTELTVRSRQDSLPFPAARENPTPNINAAAIMCFIVDYYTKISSSSGESRASSSVTGLSGAVNYDIIFALSPAGVAQWLTAPDL